jgi:RimJ/RimL family protein N-acetyltransferase
MSRYLESERLILREPWASDIAAMVPLANDYDVAKNLSKMPHPYTEADAEAFVTRATDCRAKGTDFNFAILRKPDGALLGMTGAHLRDGGAFEIGYWLGRPHWGQGYATEAARRIAAFTLSGLQANRIVAGYFHDNPASGHVLEKVGFRPDGAGERECVARGHSVYCLGMLLEREDFGHRPTEKKSRMSVS